jgi:hypothetical protein
MSCRSTPPATSVDSSAAGVQTKRAQLAVGVVSAANPGDMGASWGGNR